MSVPDTLFRESKRKETNLMPKLLLAPLAALLAAALLLAACGDDDDDGLSGVDGDTPTPTAPANGDDGDDAGEWVRERAAAAQTAAARADC
jgi:hypothetical protein